jgi:hypothetical protein
MQKLSKISHYDEDSNELYDEEAEHGPFPRNFFSVTFNVCEEQVFLGKIRSKQENFL